MQEHNNVENEIVEIIKGSPLDERTEEILIESLDLLFQYIPVIKGIYNNWRLRKIKIGIKELKKRVSDIENPNTDKFKNLFICAFENISKEKQDEKIKYIVNVIVNGSNEEGKSIDKSLIYLSLLEGLTNVELRVIGKFYNDPYFDVNKNLNVSELEEMDISEDMYNLALIHLKALGLLDNDSMKKLENYAKEITEYTQKGISEKYDYEGMGGKILLKPKYMGNYNFYLTDAGKTFVEFVLKGNDGV
ncbi:hypothetical protein [Staphylococcus simulans]|uniref:hypothetical protein n=1 Tax=Staphylococcus simulans TaxID=1286 RepID=UPI000D1E3DC0|nr:hypothetical protein [Staphylococcus simulans]PTJ36268.1 hypothetical protein BU024_10730 [Staphylococcus simulans]